MEGPASRPASNTDVTGAPRAAIAHTRNPVQRNSRCFPRDILTLIPPPRDGHEDMLPLSHWPDGDALDITTQYGCMYDARGIVPVDFSSSFFRRPARGPAAAGPGEAFTVRKRDMETDSNTGNSQANVIYTFTPDLDNQELYSGVALASGPGRCGIIPSTPPVITGCISINRGPYRRDTDGLRRQAAPARRRLHAGSGTPGRIGRKELLLRRWAVHSQRRPRRRGDPHESQRRRAATDRIRAPLSAN